MKRRRGIRLLFLDWVTAWGLIIILGVLSRIPAWFAYRFAAGAGTLFWLFASRRRERAIANLTQALGPHVERPKIVRIARQSFGSLMKVALDFARLPKVLKRGNLADYVDTTLLEKRLQDVGEGELVFISGHLGGWEVGGVSLSMLRGELNVIARKVDNPFMDEMVRRGREGFGLRIHPRRGGIRPLVKAIDRGADAALLIDQNQRKRGLFIPFFGKIASTDRSAAVLGMRRGKARPILVGFAIRTGPGFRFKMDFAPVILPTPEELANRDLEGLTTRIVQTMEEIIIRHPEQYLWLHDRYKTRPPGEKASDPSGE